MARKDYEGVSALYAPGFVPPGGVDRSAWFAERRQRFAEAGNVPVDLLDLKVRVLGLDRAVAEFMQDFDDKLQPNRTRKTLEFVKVGNAWLINSQTSAPAGGK